MRCFRHCPISERSRRRSLEKFSPKRALPVYSSKPSSGISSGRPGFLGCRGWKCATRRADIAIGSGLRQCHTSVSKDCRTHETNEDQPTKQAPFVLLTPECKDGYGTIHLRTPRACSEE